MADRISPNFKICAGCGEVRSDLALSTRSYSCDIWRLVIDRDLNAVINVARRRSTEPSEVILAGYCARRASLDRLTLQGINSASHARRVDRRWHKHHTNAMRAPSQKRALRRRVV